MLFFLGETEGKFIKSISGTKNWRFFYTRHIFPSKALNTLCPKCSHKCVLSVRYNHKQGSPSGERQEEDTRVHIMIITTNNEGAKKITNPILYTRNTVTYCDNQNFRTKIIRL